MGELLRHSKELIHPVDGKPFRASDPEAYITRLHHFATGAGFNPEHLTSGRNPMFTGKSVGFNALNSDDGPTRHKVETDYSFTEGMIPYGIADAAVERLTHNIRKYDSLPLARGLAISEVAHRKAMNINRDTFQSRGSGVINSYDIRKSVREPELASRYFYDDEDGEDWWPNGINDIEHFDLHDSETDIKGVITDTSNKFKEMNRTKKTDKEALNLAYEAINNPDTTTISQLVTKEPHFLSPQFLRASSLHRSPSHRDGFADANDVIDLKTGTWAKIDPEGYFPH